MSFRFGRYEAIRKIAQGGMATVYLGRAVAEGGFERLLAIKVMHPHIADKHEFEAMFLDEARLAASIRHPNVVSTIDVQKTPEAMFLVMEYVDGPALNRLLRKLKEHERPLPVEIVLRILIDTLNGLEAAHRLVDGQGRSLQVVHRDVSPQNILVGADGIVRLTDFGVARAEARLGYTIGGEIKGKLGYMPPEQSKGEEIDCRADVYAAGVVLWECLAFDRLFWADNPGELIFKVLEGATRSPRELRPEVPYHVDRACMKALALDPNERFQSAGEFAEALEEAAELDGVRVASSRTLAAFVAETRPLVGANTDADGSGAFELASVAAVPAAPTTSEISAMSSGTGKPHTVAVKLTPPSQGRLVTALAAVIALTLGVGAAGVMMLTQPVAADRTEPGLSDAAAKQAAAAQADVARREAAPDHLERDQPEPGTSASAAPDDPPPDPLAPETQPQDPTSPEAAPAPSSATSARPPAPTPRRRGDGTKTKPPPPEPAPKGGAGYRPGGL